MHLSHPLSPLLDAGFLEAVTRRHFEPLLDPALAPVLAPLYRHSIAFEVNGRPIALDPELAPERAEMTVRLSRKRKPSAVG